MESSEKEHRALGMAIPAPPPASTFSSVREALMQCFHITDGIHRLCTDSYTTIIAFLFQLRHPKKYSPGSPHIRPSNVGSSKLSPMGLPESLQ